MPPKLFTKDKDDPLRVIHELLTIMQAHMEAQDTHHQLLQQTMESCHDTFQPTMESLKNQV